MELSKLFKGLIILQLLSAAAIAVVAPADPVFEEALGIGMDIAVVIFVLLWLASLVLLFRFKSLGRTLFTILVIISPLLSLGMPESFVSAGTLYDLLVYFGGALDGAMLAILYLTNIKERFQKIQE